MKAIGLFIFILSIQVGLAQKTNSDKIRQLNVDFKAVEDSISKKINIENSIVCKTCENYRAFYFIKEDSYWKGYFIKNLIVDGINIPTILDTLENGELIKFEPYQTELVVFNADSIVQLLIKNQIYDIEQISEDAIQAKLTRKGKKKNERIIQTLPQVSHDCIGTIIIYGPKNISVTYRGVLIETKEIYENVRSLEVFHNTTQVLISWMKNYYR